MQTLLEKKLVLLLGKKATNVSKLSVEYVVTITLL